MRCWCRCTVHKDRCRLQHTNVSVCARKQQVTRAHADGTSVEAIRAARIRVEVESAAAASPDALRGECRASSARSIAGCITLEHSIQMTTRGKAISTRARRICAWTSEATDTEAGRGGSAATASRPGGASSRGGSSSTAELVRRTSWVQAHIVKTRRKNAKNASVPLQAP